MRDLSMEIEPARPAAAAAGERALRARLPVGQVQHLARFACAARLQQLSEDAREQLKLRILDALGAALGALDGEPAAIVRAHVREMGGAPLATLIGVGARSAPDRVALYNGTLVRYLDYNDAYLAAGETCHPSDNLAPVLAACEYAKADGATLLSALALAYQVQCRLCDVAPVRAHGFDHVTQGAYAVAAGVARALGLEETATAHAIATAGASLNALRVTRTGALSHWKGLAYPAMASAATGCALLAMRGITGPMEVFEGKSGMMDAIAGPFAIDWEREDLEAVTRTIIKRYNAEIHSQSAVQAMLELRAEHRLEPEQVAGIELQTFQVAYDIIGGGQEGEKHSFKTKEQADHSLPFLLAVALIDGELTPRQYAPERIASPRVHDLASRVSVHPDPELSRRFPAEHCARLRLRLRDGHVLERERHDYRGFHTDPMSFEEVAAKFDELAAPQVPERLRERIVETVADLEDHGVESLTGLLAGPFSPAAEKRQS